MAVFGMCGDRLDHLIPMEPEAYGCCGHSMVVSLRSGVVPVWPAQGRIVRALCSLLSSQGDPEQSASRTLGHPSFLHPGRKTQIHFRHTQPRLRGRATFLLTAATLEWITKPIGVAQKGACWLLLSKWRHLLAFVRVGNSFLIQPNCRCLFWCHVQSMLTSYSVSPHHPHCQILNPNLTAHLIRLCIIFPFLFLAHYIWPSAACIPLTYY